jgi:hypothetical protein
MKNVEAKRLILGAPWLSMFPGGETSVNTLAHINQLLQISHFRSSQFLPTTIGGQSISDLL